MNKTLYTLAVDGYPSAITDLTFPLLRTYARKIGADFYIIRSRSQQYERWPAACEKLQVFDLAAVSHDAWSIFLDADALVHPDCFDITEHLPRDTVLHHSVDRSTVRFDADHYFQRDGRFLSPGNWMAVASSWCRDLWAPPTQTLEEALARIHPTVVELNSGITRAHLADDYLVAKNRARFGLKVTTFTDLCASLNEPPKYFWHQYGISTDDKVAAMKNVLTQWGITL